MARYIKRKATSEVDSAYHPKKSKTKKAGPAKKKYKSTYKKKTSGYSRNGARIGRPPRSRTPELEQKSFESENSKDESEDVEEGDVEEVIGEVKSESKDQESSIERKEEAALGPANPVAAAVVGQTTTTVRTGSNSGSTDIQTIFPTAHEYEEAPVGPSYPLTAVLQQLLQNESRERAYTGMKFPSSPAT